MTDKSTTSHKIKYWVIGFFVLLALGSGSTILSRIDNAHALEALVKQQSQNFVKAAIVKHADEPQMLTLPGTLLGSVGLHQALVQRHWRARQIRGFVGRGGNARA